MATASKKKLTRAEYATDPVTLAKSLLGAVLVRTTARGRVSGRIVETEAYLGVEDLAAHSAGARRTARTEPMFGKPGTSYVFRTYGMHDLFNVVCGAEGEPVAVLVRALAPLEGIDLMRENRTGAKAPVKPLRDVDLCAGPARLTRALGIDRSLSNIDLVTHEGLWVEPPFASVPKRAITTTKRVNVDYAAAWADRPLRYYLTGDPHVSRPLIPPPLVNR